MPVLYEPPDNPDLPIRVVVRKRPLSRREIAKGETDVMDIQTPVVHVHEHKLKVDLTRCTETHTFAFDDAFDEMATTEEVYQRSLRHLVRTVFEGFKATCFAYGQTGSGKTFTMMGADPARPAMVRKNAGLYVLAARDMFELLSSPRYSRLKAYASCFEIYGGKLFDLFNGRVVVRCLEDHKQRVQIMGLSEHEIVDVATLMLLMESGATNRSTGTTGANADSSRSHAILQLTVRDPSKKGEKVNLVGKFSFIDLAGSERGADTRHADRQTRMEGAEINTSLLALKEVIRALDKKQGHTPFRGSKLTQVLKDSFVGDKTRTLMIACVSPNRVNCEHTLNTLRYADRVKEHDASACPTPSASSQLSSTMPGTSETQSRPALASTVAATTIADHRSPVLSPIATSASKPGRPASVRLPPTAVERPGTGQSVNKDDMSVGTSSFKGRNVASPDIEVAPKTNRQAPTKNADADRPRITPKDPAPLAKSTDTKSGLTQEHQTMNRRDSMETMRVTGDPGKVSYTRVPSNVSSERSLGRSREDDMQALSSSRTVRLAQQHLKTLTGRA
jgi:hypothetical protein